MVNSIQEEQIRNTIIELEKQITLLKIQLGYSMEGEKNQAEGKGLEVNRLSKKLIEKIMKTRRMYKIQEKTINFIIDSGNVAEDSQIIMELLKDLIPKAKELKIPFEYKLKSGSIDVSLIFPDVHNIAMGVISGLILTAITSLKNRKKIRGINLDINGRIIWAKGLHADQKRSFSCIVSQEESEEGGTKFVILDNDGKSYEYNVFPDGSYRIK